jgi:NAD+ diphosphatase
MNVVFGWPSAYQSLHQAPSASPEAAFWFVYRAGHLLVAQADSAMAELPSISHPSSLGLVPLREHYLGLLGNRHCYAAEVDVQGNEEPPGWGWQPLRRLHGALHEDHYALAGRALQLLEWERSHRFCGACGAEMVRKASERARECPNCRAVSYPRVTPVIMALVRRGRRILLARSPHFAPGVVSVLAGFVEPGETIEQCVAREVFEEVGLRVSNVRYVASQPWPFPHSLMMGFFADCNDGEIHIDPVEIAEAGWFEIDDLPKLPAKLSLARVLIEAAIHEMKC